MFFFDVFSASLEIDAQDIKVALPRYYVLQKRHPTRIGVPSRGSCFSKKNMNFEKLWCWGRAEKKLCLSGRRS